MKKSDRRPLNRRWLFLTVAAVVCALEFGLLPAQLTDGVKEAAGRLSIQAGSKIYAANQKPRFSVHFSAAPAAASGPLSWLAPPPAVAADVPLDVKLLYGGRLVEMPAEIEVTSANSYLVQLNPAGAVKPGEYTLVIKQAGQADTQAQNLNFAWGVLAINTDRATYTVGQTANLQMGVLSSTGHTICNAPLNLFVTDPAGQQSQLNVQQSGLCRGDSYVTQPDYFASYPVNLPGHYQLKLQLADSSYSLDSSFEAAASPSFDIQRIGPTRIYPPVPYQMALQIQARQDFSGHISEELPAGFSVLDSGGARVISNGGGSTLIWNVKWQAGRSYRLAYQFKAPDVSPAFYFVGPLRLTDNSGNLAFQEARSWQIAGDAIAFVSNVMSGTSSNGTSLTTSNLSAGATAGDLLVAMICVADNASNPITTPSGWTRAGSASTVTNTNTNGENAAVFYKVAAGGEQNVTISWTSSAEAEIWLGDYSGLNTSSVEDTGVRGSNAPASTAAYTVSAGSASSTANELFLAGAFTTASPTLGSLGGGFTQRNSGSSGGSGSNKANLIVLEKVVAATTTPTASGTLSSAKPYVGIISGFEAPSGGGCSSPTTDQLMRGGDWFCSNTEQGFFWAQ